MMAREALQAVVDRFDPAKAKGVDATVQLSLSGEDGGEYQLRIVDGKISILDGTAEGPNATIGLAARDWTALVGGEMDSTTAFMTGKLRIGGDFGLMMRLQSLLGA